MSKMISLIENGDNSLSAYTWRFNLKWMVPLVLAVIQNSTMSTVEKLQAGQSKFWMCYVQTIRVLLTAFTPMAPLIQVFQQPLLKLIFLEPFVIKIASQHLSLSN